MSWRIEESNVGIADTGDYDGVTKIISEKGEIIAEWWNKEGEEFERMVRLIAFAPEMLNLLKRVLEDGHHPTWEETFPLYTEEEIANLIKKIERENNENTSTNNNRSEHN